ncbi:MAG: hypothetical protein HWE09_15670, partial [Cyclobacteriaceae bacterium]|nr:hypothetical protein [Cyclobacteriaceae bacterium]
MNKYLLPFICFGTLLFSCKESDKFSFYEEKVTPLQMEALPDSLSPPKIIRLSEVKAPDIFEITPTKIPLKYPYGVGKPTVKSYGVNDGLPGDLVQDLVLDQQGNLWIGGIGFLSKFDGSTFTNFNISNGLESVLISQLLVDSDNNIWIGTLYGLYKYDGYRFHQISLSEDDRNHNFLSLIQDQDGTIWASSQKGIFRISEDSVQVFGKDDGVPLGLYYTLFLDQSGRIIATSTTENYVYTNGRFEPFDKIPAIGNSHPVILTIDQEGSIWFRIKSGDKDQLGKYDGQKTSLFGKAEGFDHQERIYGAETTKSGEIWINTEKGTYTYKNGIFNFYSAGELDKLNFSSVVEDDLGNYWIITRNRFVKINFNLTNPLEIPEGDSDNLNNSIRLRLAIGPNGSKWVISSKQRSSLFKYEKNEAIKYDLEPVFGEGFFFLFLFADKNGNIWLSNGGNQNIPKKLIKFDGSKFHIYGVDQGIKMDFVRNISEDKDGNIVLVTSSGVYFINNEIITYYGEKQGFPELITSIVFDQKNRMWVGTGYSGAIAFTQDSVLKVNTSNGLPNNFVNDLTVGPNGTIWMGTDGGIGRIDGNQLSTFGQAEGLGSIATSIFVDTLNQQLWFGTTKGLATLSFEESQSENPQFRIFSKQNGFENIPSFLGTGEKIQVRSSDIWMNTFSDLVRFNWKQLQEIKSPSVKIKNIRINNTNLLWSLFLEENDSLNKLTVTNESVLKFSKKPEEEFLKELQNVFGNIEYDSLQRGDLIPINLRLPYTNNSITFEFSSVSPAYGKYFQYRYKLEGYEENWSPVSLKNEAYFGNMTEGEYTFKLEAFSPFGTTSKLSYTFKVLPPWWRTWWAYLIYLIMLLLLGRRIHAFQKERTIRKEREKAKDRELEQAREIEKAYQNLELAHENLKATQTQLIQSEKMASLGELTAGIAHEIQNPLNFVNNFSEINKELIADLKEEIEKGDMEEVKLLAADIESN